MANGLMQMPPPGAMPPPTQPHFQQGPQAPMPGVGGAPQQPAQPAPQTPQTPQMPSPISGYPAVQPQPVVGQPPAPGQPQFGQPPQTGYAPQPAPQPHQQQMQPPPYATPQHAQDFQHQTPQQNPQYAPQPQAPARPFFESFGGQQPTAPTQQPLDAATFAQQVAQQMQAAQQPADPYAVPVPEADLTNWEQHRPAMERMFAEMVNTHIAPKFGQVSQQVEAASGMRSDLDALRSETYQSSIRAAVPDLDTVANSPEFQQYRNTVLPGGITVDTLMRSAHQNRNAAALIDVFRGFQSHQSGHQQAQPQQMSNGFTAQAQQYAQPHVAPGASLYPGASPQQGISEQAAAEVLDRYSRGHATEAEYMAVEAALQQQTVQPTYR